MGIRVVAINNLNVSLPRALIRGVALYGVVIPLTIDLGLAHVIAYSICFLFIFFPPDPKIGKRRHVFDLLAGTCVIKAVHQKESNI